MCDPFICWHLQWLALYFCVTLVCPSWSFFLLYCVSVFALLCFWFLVCLLLFRVRCVILVVVRPPLSCRFFVLWFWFLVCRSWSLFLYFVGFCFVIFCSWCVARAREEEIERGSEGETKGVELKRGGVMWGQRGSEVERVRKERATERGKGQWGGVGKRDKERERERETEQEQVCLSSSLSLSQSISLCPCNLKRTKHRTRPLNPN